jgi:hypothetical protein
MELVSGEALAGDALGGAGHLPDRLHHPLGASASAAQLEQEHHALGGQDQREESAKQEA